MTKIATFSHLRGSNTFDKRVSEGDACNPHGFNQDALQLLEDIGGLKACLISI